MNLTESQLFEFHVKCSYLALFNKAQVSDKIWNFD